jgi:trans-aconitate methyltransferase
MAYTTDSITIYIFTNGSKYGIFEFASYISEPWDSIYKRVLDYLKQIDDEEQCNDYSMTIIVKNKSIYELLNFVYMLSTCMIIFNHIQYNCDMGIITKTVHALNIVNAPYYVRYLIKTFIIHKKEFFEKVQSELENNSTYKIEMCFLPNQKMREQVVKDELSFKNQIIDFGCGEGHYLGLSKKLDNNLYYAIDKNEECRNIVEKIINKKELDNVVVAESLNDIDFEAFNQCEIIMSEVFEHNTLKEDTKILTKFMKSNCSKIIITTPNKSFNKYYSLSNDQLRHNDHKFEMTKEECHEYFDDLCKKFQNYSYIMTDIGDKVDGISTTLLIVIQKD